ncbi:hypothetical protein BST14_04610 [Mycobacterium arosiense ATCC BAA-1401 = DSM 45069]|uniref:Uncharacterized protein n=2 Tax=Mycobacterium arosiense TaxID=425468 RepID=A0A1W9ZPA6_MYCAI|nr:hypothetical protein BST14_04610 [Mycobacterium arosiense ATCC BAA-1401 = DSM 45069]
MCCGTKETVMTVGAAPPSVFEAELPTLCYDPDALPAQVYPRLREPVLQGLHLSGPKSLPIEFER